MLLNGEEIWDLVESDNLIDPFIGYTVKKDNKGQSVISYGLASNGYDLTLAEHDFRVFKNRDSSRQRVVDPKHFDSRWLSSVNAEIDETGAKYFFLYPHSYALGVSREKLNIPNDIFALFITKSTYARSGIIINCSGAQSGWEGYLTIEIINASKAPCKIYCNEGICQALFMSLSPSESGYGNGKYQNQINQVVLAK